MKRWLTPAFVLLSVCSPHVYGQLPADDGETPWFRQGPDSSKYALIIAGAAASPQIRETFRGWSANLVDVFRSDYGYEAGNVLLLLDDGENVGDLAPIVAGSSQVEDVRSTLQSLSGRMNEGDQLTVILLGHGSGTFGDAKFNNVGPDMTGAEFAEMLTPFTGQDLVIINTTSASFEFTRELAAPGRVLISATRSPAERYDPVFAGHLITALREKRADLDRNGRVSVLEAFNYASGQVASWYADQGRLPTENAVLDDNGDGLFSREPGVGQADGMLAEIAYFDVIRAVTDKTSPQALALRAQMQDLERDIIILRNQKDNYLEADYWNRLEALLIDLALRTREYHALP